MLNAENLIGLEYPPDQPHLARHQSIPPTNRILHAIKNLLNFAQKKCVMSLEEKMYTEVELWIGSGGYGSMYELGLLKVYLYDVQPKAIPASGSTLMYLPSSLL